MNHFIGKLKNLFTAIAYAEAGDFDAVKQILREGSDKSVSEASEEFAAKGCSSQPVIPAM